jgi:hypothetical protein
VVGGEWIGRDFFIKQSHIHTHTLSSTKPTCNLHTSTPKIYQLTISPKPTSMLSQMPAQVPMQVITKRLQPHLKILPQARTLVHGKLLLYTPARDIKIYTFTLYSVD